MDVTGSITAQSLHVNELTADIRNERSTSLEFDGDNVAGKGLVWRTPSVSRQFVFHENPDRMFSSENIDLARTKHYSIGTVPVITETDLGSTIINSSLTNLGVLDSLSVTGNVDFDGYLFWEADVNRLGIGTDNPNATLSIANLDAEFIIDSENESGKLQSLMIRQNQISQVPEMSMKQMPSLRVLQISSNSLNRLPSSITTCHTLEEIYVNGNALKKLPSCIDRLEKVKVLNACDNQIQVLPSGFIDRFGRPDIKTGKCSKVSERCINCNFSFELNCK